MRKYIKEESSFSGRYDRSVWKTISLMFQTIKTPFLFFFVLGFIGRSFLLANTNLIGKWADQNFIAPEKFLMTLLVITSVGFVFYGAFRIMIARLGTQAASLLYDETTWRVSRFPISFFDMTPVGRIITRFSSDYNSIFRMAGGPLGEFLSISFDLILFFALIVWASPLYIPIVVASMAINLFIYSKNKEQIRFVRREHTKSRSPAIAHFAETIQGTKMIRVYGKEASFSNQFLKKFDDYIEQKTKSNFKSNSFSLQMSCANSAILLLTGLFGILLIGKGYVTPGSLGVAFTFIAMMQTTVQIFFEWISALEDAASGTERMSEYLNKPTEPGSFLPTYARFHTEGHRHLALNTAQNDIWQKSSSVSICVESLSVRYEGSESLALDNVSFFVRPKEKMGIIGATGSGKTTLLQSLFHLYPFEKGTIQIDGKSAWLDTSRPCQSNEIPLDSFRKGISLITQDPILFSGTLRENLICDSTQITDDAIFKLIKTLGFENGFLSENKGLDQLVTEKGSNLSLGEKQIACMIRCFLQESPVILMDEATSNIDPVSEGLLVNASKQILSDKTQIIIAHRLSTIKDCDRILWLHHGKIMALDEPSVVLPQFMAWEQSQQPH